MKQSISLETIENKRKRLIFRSWHRGTREMDIIMGRFADEYVPSFDEQALAEYDEILSLPDPDLYNWYSGKEDVPDHDKSDVMDLFLSFKIT